MNKNLYTLFFFAVCTLSVSAQQATTIVKQINESDINFPPAEVRVFYDSLAPGSQQNLGFGGCGDTMNIYQLASPGHGYVGGNNSNGDLEIMQKFGVDGSGGVYTILGFFGKKSNTSNGAITGRVYEINDTTHGPGTLLFETDPTLLADVDTLWDIFSSFQFPGQIQVYDSFFVSIVLPTAAGDSVAVYMTPHNCISGYQQSYVKRANGTFAPLNGGAGTYGFSSDFWIWAVFIPDSSIGINSAISSNGLKLYRAYPNPSSQSVNMNFALDNANDVRIEFISTEGKTVKSVSLGMLSAGIHSKDILISDLPAGNYIYSIITPQQRLFSMVSVVRN